LGGHLKHFKAQIQELAPFIIQAALKLHTSITQSFRKTAINFHYEFNIRHISNVFNGLLITLPQQFQDPEKMIRVWIHESERTYCDRLVTMENVILYKSIMFDLVKKSFTKYNFTRYFQEKNQENLIFCNFINGIGGERVYD
jgi:dynein heavy chain